MSGRSFLRAAFGSAVTLTGLALSGSLAIGCSVGVAETAPTVDNTCETSADCGDGGSCAKTFIGSFCAAKEAELGDVILLVRPTNGGNTSYVFEHSLSLSGENARGHVESIQLALPAKTAMSFGLEAPSTDAWCIGTDKTIPVELTFYPRGVPRELASPTRASSTIVATDAATTTAVLTTEIQEGLYDIHVRPIADPTCAGVPSPVLYKGVNIGTEPVEWTPDVGDEVALSGTVRVPADVSFEGWSVEVVEPVYGEPVSRTFVIGPEHEELIGLGGAAGIPMAPTVGAIVRLRSPNDELKVHFDLATLDLNSDQYVEIDLGDLIATPVTIEATVTDGRGALATNAQVAIRSRSLTGTAKQNASYTLSTRTDEDGRLLANLVPGDYDVSIVAEGTGSATFLGSWAVDESFGAEPLSIELPAQPRLVGTIETPSGEGLEGANFLVTPNAVATKDYFESVFGVTAPVGRTFSVLTGPSGDFELAVDPGKSNIYGRREAMSGFPWVVLPSVIVQPATSTPIMDLAVLVAPYPVLVQAEVLGPDGSALPFALVSAWVPGGDGALVQVGESSTDAEGRFLLPLSPSLTSAAKK